jgi:hypothetical protein
VCVSEVAAVMIRVLPVALGVVPRGTNLGRACPMVRPPVQKSGSLPQAGALPLPEQSATSEASDTAGYGVAAVATLPRKPTCGRSSTT